MADLITMLSAVAGQQGEEVDDDFNQTVLLLHGDGTNGAQNNTFLDSSTNNFTITRNGNITQGTFSPFSVGAGEWSNYFDGSGDYLSLSYNTAFDLTQGNFCVEMWIYRVASGAEQYLWSSRTSPASTGWEWRINSTNLMQFFYTGGSSITSASSIPSNTWTHLAVTRDSTTVRMFINGAVDATATFSNGTSVTSTGLFIGYSTTGGGYFPGYFSNARLVKGSAVYTSAFTPSTTPLTAITNTSLLTCQSNRFVDNSTNAFAITRNGDVRVTPFSPFAPTAEYDAGTNGGSGYFDGTGDYLTAAAASDWTFLHNGSDWTCEFWLYHTGTSLYGIASTTAFSTQTGMSILVNNTNNSGLVNGLQVYIVRGVSASEAVFNSTALLAVNQWNYVAITFTSSTKTCAFTINGASAGSSSNTGFSYSASNPTNTLAIGRYQGTTPGGDLPGYIASLRISTNVRTGLTSVPTAPYTSDANTKLLCNFTNAGIIDNTGKNNLETVGNAQIDTTTKKFGTGSLEFDGTGDWLLMPNTPDQQLGTGNFTIEFWVYLASGDTGSARGLVAKGGASTGWLVSLDSSQKVVFTYTTSTITSSGAITTNAWNHIAVVRSGTGSNQTKIYIGGTNDGTGTVSTDFNQAESMYVGANRTGGDPMKGFIDDLRITKGIARYTANFSVPGKAFPDL